MKERNEYFASVFSAELNHWKQLTGKTQSEFAEITRIHPNSISRYKKGDAFPTPPVLAVICETLNVEESIFYPNTPHDLIKYDPAFRQAIIEDVIAESFKHLETMGIDKTFFAFCTYLPYFNEYFPFSSIPNSEGDPFAFVNCNNLENLIKFSKSDLEFIKDLQEKATEYIMALVIKEKYDKRQTN